MKIFISGGSKSGKSTRTQDLAAALAAGKPLYYVATMIAGDEEDDARILRHIRERDGMGFITVEQGRDILQILTRTDPSGTFMMDSVTALLSNEMFVDGEFRENAGELVAKQLEELSGKVENILFVSDYIYSDARRYSDFTENYRAALASVDRKLAACCDVVIEMCGGNMVVHKGEQYLEQIH